MLAGVSSILNRGVFRPVTQTILNQQCRFFSGGKRHLPSKQKSKSAAKKRFLLSAGGIKRMQVGKQHHSWAKPHAKTKIKGQRAYVSRPDHNRILGLLKTK
eukprot:gb/GECH01012824.1/.p1 GENE.gb/GECH01012824.1/~~gb/GECH01012824.1/.p1  ORF type:complete len:101 (+),score=17.93 gb/GECH01012824.1/:1-303(+)